MAPAPMACGRFGVAGIADGIARQAVALERQGGDRGLAAAGHEGLAEAEKASGSAPTKAAACVRLMMHRAIIGVVVTRRRKGSQLS